MNSFFFGPHTTPKSIKRGIVFLIFCALLTPISTFFLQSFHLKGPLDFLPLTLIQFKEHYYFQVITYPLVQSTSSVITLSLLLSLTFHLFIFWFTGSELLLRLKGKMFLFLLMSSILVPTCFFLISQWFIKDFSALYGMYPFLFSLLTVLALEVGSLEIRLLLFIRFRLRNVIFLFLALLLIIDLSHGQYSYFFTKIAAMGWGIFFSKVFLQLPLPFRRKKKCEIIEITDWEIGSDDAFINEMLDKAIKEGKESLTDKEKQLLDAIIKKKDH